MNSVILEKVTVGFWRRLVAIIIDSIIILIVNGLISSFIGLPMRASDADPALIVTIQTITNAIVYNFYLIVFPVASGGTLGKNIMKIEIVGQDGKWMSYKTSFIRHLPIFILSLGSLFISSYTTGVLAIIWMAMTNIYVVTAIIILVASKENRTIHDLLARTYVIRIEKGNAVSQA